VFPNPSNQGACRAFVRELQVLLAQAYRPVVVLDLSSVQVMNVAGVDVLLKCMEEVAANDGELKLAAASPETGVVLRLTQITRIVEIFASVEEALASTQVLPFVSASSMGAAHAHGGNSDSGGPVPGEMERKQPWVA
jgi:anti-anti-sigma factor